MRRVGVARSIALQGLRGVRVLIECDVASGLPNVHVVGMPDAAVKQAQHRTWSAIAHTGLEAPSGKVVVNLTPASLPKGGSHFDLPIAIAVLRATGVVPHADDDGTVLLGELSLDGRLRPISGVLPMVRAAQQDGATRVVVATANADEAALVEGVRVDGVASLGRAAELLGATLELPPDEPFALDAQPVPRDAALDLADVIGNETAIDALEVAAAGAHHVFMIGPPGAGKTMLAARLPGLLPPLDIEQALDVASLRSLMGVPPAAELDTVPPFEAPHHSATAASLVGGGGAIIRPGAAARASHGVLFLDECPEFPRHVLDTLRQPLESGRITIHRSQSVAEYPATFQLVLAANPCPCGKHGTGDCSCTPNQRRSYLGRLSGPLLDRVDLHVHVQRIGATEARVLHDAPRRQSATARARVLAARDRALHRLRGTPWTAMGHVPGPWLRREARLDARVTAPIDDAVARGAITMRGYDRLVRVAFTLADLDGTASPTREHLGRALFFRKGMTP